MWELPAVSSAVSQKRRDYRAWEQGGEFYITDTKTSLSGSAEWSAFTQQSVWHPRDNCICHLRHTQTATTAVTERHLSMGLEQSHKYLQMSIYITRKTQCTNNCSVICLFKCIYLSSFVRQLSFFQCKYISPYLCGSFWDCSSTTFQKFREDLAFPKDGSNATFTCVNHTVGMMPTAYKLNRRRRMPSAVTGCLFVKWEGGGSMASWVAATMLQYSQTQQPCAFYHSTNNDDT